MLLGTHSHQNYAMIDDLVPEAIHRLCLPAIVAGGFAAQRLGHTIHHNHIDIVVHMSHPGMIHQVCHGDLIPCFPNVHNERHVPEALGWPQSSKLNDPHTCVMVSQTLPCE